MAPPVDDPEKTLKTVLSALIGLALLILLSWASWLPALAQSSAELSAGYARIDVVIAGIGRQGDLDASALHAEIAALAARGLSVDQATDIVAEFARNRVFPTADVVRMARLFPAFSIAAGWPPTFAARMLNEAFDDSDRGYALQQIEHRLSVWDGVQFAQIDQYSLSGDTLDAHRMMMDGLEDRFAQRTPPGPPPKWWVGHPSELLKPPVIPP